MDVQLAEFDREFFESIEDRDLMAYRDYGKYHTILANGKKAGIVGFLPSKRSADEGFVQIVLVPTFRGKGISKLAENLLAERYGLKRLYATVLKSNLNSINSHSKIGFKMLSEAEMENLRCRNLMSADEIRMVKEY